MPSTLSSMQQPTSYGQDFLDIQGQTSYISNMLKQCLIKNFAAVSRRRGTHGSTADRGYLRRHCGYKSLASPLVRFRCGLKDR